MDTLVHSLIGPGRTGPGPAAEKAAAAMISHAVRLNAPYSTNDYLDDVLASLPLELFENTR